MFMIISSIADFAFAAFLVGFMYKRDAIHWNYLAKTYARPWQKPISERSPMPLSCSVCTLTLRRCGSFR